jgi:hypothetical protein
MPKVKLYELAHARSGDKGDISNISLIPYNEKDYAMLEQKVTAEVVAEHFRDIVNGKVERYELPNLKALNFVLHDALAGGVTNSLRLDGHGKTLSSWLLELEIEIEQPTCDN